MNDTNPESSGQKEDFFQVQGYVYLRIERLDALSQDTQEDLPEFMDTISLDILHFKKRMKYDAPPEAERLGQLTRLIEQIHASQIGGEKPLILKRHDVIISGSGIEFQQDIPYEAGTGLSLTISFTGYPFQTISVAGEVKSVVSVQENGLLKYKMYVEYQDISELDRELIIKFVNHLQRKKLNEEKAAQGGKPTPELKSVKADSKDSLPDH